MLHASGVIEYTIELECPVIRIIRPLRLKTKVGGAERSRAQGMIVHFRLSIEILTRLTIKYLVRRGWILSELEIAHCANRKREQEPGAPHCCSLAMPFVLTALYQVP
jgi:hypothetical protein